MSDSKNSNFIPGDDASPADALTHSLLEQVAANRSGADEDFLNRVEAAIDADDGGVIPMPQRAQRPWKPLTWSAVAAVVILLAGGTLAIFFVNVNERPMHGQIVQVTAYPTEHVNSLDTYQKKVTKPAPVSGATDAVGVMAKGDDIDASGLADLNFDTESIASIRKIEIEGDSRTMDKVVRREIPLEPGASYSPLAESSKRQRLENMNYFARVDVDSRREGLDGLETAGPKTSDEKVTSANAFSGFDLGSDSKGSITYSQDGYDEGISVSSGSDAIVPNGRRWGAPPRTPSPGETFEIGGGIFAGYHTDYIFEGRDKSVVDAAGGSAVIAEDTSYNISGSDAWDRYYRANDQPVEMSSRATERPFIGYAGAPEEWLKANGETVTQFGRVPQGADASIETGIGGKSQDILFGGVSLSVDLGEPAGIPAIESKSTRYNPLVDNEWMSPREEPLSTFSSDVDTASWTNLRGMIRSGLSIGQIPNDAVRIEEMINYFDWDYAKPEGDHPFSFAAETASCPWNADHQLLRVGVQGAEISRKDRPDSNLVFLIDVSGSMDRSNKLALVKKSIMVLAEELRENDCVSMVVYAGAEGLALPATSGRDTMAIANALTKLNAGGSTNGGAGINLAYRMAKENFIEDGVNRVILCTDGDFNVGVTGNESLVKMVERRAKDGVFLSVLGFGNDNLNDSMLEEITNKGNGNYFFIDSLEEARKVLLRDLMGTLVAIAKDVKIQIEFNPAKVDGYRLIGYANRKLEAEDFANDRVDAGEVGSGHSVTALYEIIPAGKGLKKPGNLRYQKAAKPAPDLELVESNELALLKLRYKKPDGDVSTLMEQPVVPTDTNWEKATGDFRFASAVSLFGLILRDHESAKGATLDQVISLAESGKGNDPLGYRAEFIDLVKILKGANEKGGVSLDVSF